MRKFDFDTLGPIRAGFGAAVAIALLAGCSGGSSKTPLAPGIADGSAKAHSLLRTAHPELATLPGMKAKTVRGLPRVRTNTWTGGGTVWVTDSGNNSVYRCTTSSCVAEGSGWNEPQGIAADSNNDVYIADTANSRIVELSDAGAQVAVLSDPGEYPVGVGVSSNGTVGVTNICNSASCGQGDIVFYTAGSTVPTSTATGLLYRYYFGGFDAAGNFYNDGEDASGNVHVGVVAAGGTTDVDTGITGISFPGGVEVNPSSGLLSIDDQLCACIDQFSLPSFTPGATIALSGASDPVSFGLGTGGAVLWTADAGLAQANEYVDPAGGSPLTSLTGFSEPIGAVVTDIKTKKQKKHRGPTEIINQFNTLPNGLQPTNFEIVLQGDLVNQICGAINPPCLDQPLYGPYNPFCPPSQGPNNPCYPTVTYNASTNTTTVTYSGPTLYPNSINHPGLYHFGLFATTVSSQWLKGLELNSYWSYPSSPNNPQPIVSINSADWQKSASTWDYAEVFVSVALSPGGPAVYGTWNDVPYIPSGLPDILNASSQPKLSFKNYGTQTLYVVSAGIIPGLSTPGDPACQTDVGCIEDMNILSILNFAGSPPPGTPGSQFIPLTYPPAAILKPQRP